LNELSEEGVLAKIQGKGTFVTTRRSKKLLTIDISSFGEFCRQNDMKPQRRMILKTREKADEADIELLGLPDDSDIIHITRVLYADDIPLIIADDRIIDEYKYLLNEDLENGSLNANMLRDGLINKLSSISRTVEVCTATAIEAEQLCVKIGSPLLLIRDITVDEKGRAVRRTKELVVGDKVRISYHSQF
jgi:GntR family transcriptional regulator